MSYQPCCLTPAGPEGIVVRLATSAGSAADPEIDRCWSELVAANPRLYDGPVLLVDRSEPSVLHARAGRYRELATAAALGRSLRSIGVQGIVRGRDAAGDSYLLLGRRGGQTRIYGGLWENAPAGSLVPPEISVSELGLPDFAAALQAEGLEELGLDLSRAAMRVDALLDDPEARSLDIVLEVLLDRVIEPGGSICRTAGTWEYVDSAWVELDVLRHWAQRHAHAISPPTHLVIQQVLRSIEGSGPGS